ncbi:MAG: hypothetical protein JW917_10895 [Ignavibacteria bacterium]|nr:hypothetical protein [Ignavibacteria bacterium]
MSKGSKFWLTILIFSGIAYLGAINIRFIIGNELLNFDEFNFKSFLLPVELSLIFKFISYSSLVIIVSYFIVFISAILFLINYKVNYRENVWLLVSAILFFVFSPVEFYSCYLDFKFYLMYLEDPYEYEQKLLVFGERIGLLKGVPWIAMLCYYTIIVISIFKPLKKTKAELEEADKENKDYAYKYIMHEEDDIIKE